VTDLKLDAAQAVADEVDGDAYVLDVSSDDSVRQAVAAAESDLGRIDVLVNNAGYDEWGWFAQTEPEMWDRVLAVNLRGVLAVTHAVIPGMQERKSGRIVSVASEAGRAGSAGSCSYSAAKAGVIGFTKALAQESARFNITVNAIAPGPIETPLLMGAREFGDIGNRIIEGMISKTVMRRLGQPDEVAAAITFLATDDSSFVTGQTLGVSGGLYML
jgi:2-hydroxycyclohexanecarboxyl-CoA dehydrogenase